MRLRRVRGAETKGTTIDSGRRAVWDGIPDVPASPIVIRAARASDVAAAR
jgi:hypothetical protein